MRRDLHKILQEMLENNENLHDLSGKIIIGKAREHQQMIQWILFAILKETRQMLN